MTFLFNDVKGSTRRWEADADAMAAALAVHDKVLRKAIEVRGGFLFSVMAEFEDSVTREPPIPFGAPIDFFPNSPQGD